MNCLIIIYLTIFPILLCLVLQPLFIFCILFSNISVNHLHSPKKLSLTEFLTVKSHDLSINYLVRFGHHQVFSPSVSHAHQLRSLFPKTLNRAFEFSDSDADQFVQLSLQLSNTDQLSVFGVYL
jgi:hypothetical protein